jgi:hypothetical protein
MKKQIRLIIVTGLMALTVGSFQNCAKTNFAASTNDGGSNGQGGPGAGGTAGGTGYTTDTVLAICNNNSFQTVTKKLKVLLVVDNSGSTLTTDPNKFRQASIQSLINKYSGKANFSWQIVLFNGTSARALVNNNANPNDPKFSNSAAAQVALDVFKAEVASGNTPYLAAISMAKTAISTDVDFNSVDAPLYVTMFMSDGQPTDSSDSQILAAEKSMLDLAPTRITFNSLYFGADNSTANQNRLKAMSDLGKGQFTNITSQQAVINIDDISVIPQSGCK